MPPSGERRGRADPDNRPLATDGVTIIGYCASQIERLVARDTKLVRRAALPVRRRDQLRHRGI